jgi:hypothetical protein
MTLVSSCKHLRNKTCDMLEYTSSVLVLELLRKDDQEHSELCTRVHHACHVADTHSSSNCQVPWRSL